MRECLGFCRGGGSKRDGLVDRSDGVSISPLEESYTVSGNGNWEASERQLESHSVYKAASKPKVKKFDFKNFFPKTPSLPFHLSEHSIMGHIKEGDTDN